MLCFIGLKKITQSTAIAKQKANQYCIEACFYTDGIWVSLQKPVCAHLTYKLGRITTPKGAPLAVGCALREVENSRVNMVLVGKTTVHGLTGHLLVPLPIGTGYSHHRVRLGGG